MGNLSWKEKRNLYEAVRMTPEEQEEWERGLGVKITPVRRYRIEGFNDAVAFVEGGLSRSDTGILRGSGIYHQKIINEKIREQNEILRRRAVCVKCGKWFERATGQEENGLMYCGYCHAACFSKKDTRWIPGKKD